MDVSGVLSYANISCSFNMFVGPANKSKNTRNIQVSMVLDCVLPSVPDQILKTSVPCREQTQGALEVKLQSIQLLIGPRGFSVSGGPHGQITSHPQYPGAQYARRPLLSSNSLPPCPFISDSHASCDLYFCGAKRSVRTEAYCTTLTLLSQTRYLLHACVLFVHKHFDRPFHELSATLLSLSPSFCLQTLSALTLSKYLKLLYACVSIIEVIPFVTRLAFRYTSYREITWKALWQKHQRTASLTSHLCRLKCCLSSH